MHSTKQDNNKFLIALIKAVTVLLTYFNCATLSNTQIQLQQSFIVVHNNYISSVFFREREIESNNTVYTVKKNLTRINIGKHENNFPTFAE